MNERPLTGVLLVGAAAGLAYLWATGSLNGITAGLGKLVSGQTPKPKLTLLGGGPAGAGSTGSNVIAS